MHSSSSVSAVADEVYQVRIPLPFALNRVNAYLLRGPEGWTILDSGLNLPECRAVWQAAFAALAIAPETIAQIVLTHMHPDHYGLAGWLQALAGGRPPVFMSAGEAHDAQIIWVQRDGRVGQMLALMRACGVPEAYHDGIIAAGARMAELTAPHPTRVEILAPGETITFGGRSFTIVHAPGHSDAQLLFYDASDRLLLSGDHVLMKITPNIGLWPDTQPRPLQRYLASLRELRALDVRLALPGHKSLIADWRGRIDELLAHHDHRLVAMEKVAVNSPDGATVFEVSRAIFDYEKLTAHEIRFAVAETLAHLEALREAGRVQRDEVAGVWRYGSP